MDAFRKIYPEEYYKKFLEQNVRPDGRGLSGIRKTIVTLGSLQNSDGSAFVKIGSTTCVCGARAELGKRSAQGPNLAINVELLPLCSSKFTKGRPSDQAQVVAQFLNYLTKSIIAPEEFHCTGAEIESEGLAWYIWLDVYCLDYDGNILDTALLATIGALKNVTLPNVRNVNGVYCASTERPNSLKLRQYPYSLSFCMVDKFLICDPTSEEEQLKDGTFTIVVDENGGLIQLSKPNGRALEEEELSICIQRATQRANQVRGLIDVADNNLKNYES